MIEDGVEVLDLFPVFMKHKDEYDLFSKEHHISPFGAKIVGEYIADYIINTTDKVDDILNLSKEIYKLCPSDFGNSETQTEYADLYYINDGKDKTFYWNQYKENSKVVIFGDCNLQSYSSIGGGVSANLAWFLKHPVYNAGRKLIYGYMERPITLSELEELIRFDIVIYINFASAPYVRTAMFSLRHPALEYKWCNFNIK